MTGSATCAGCGSGCSGTASSRTSPGRSPEQLGWPDTFDAEYVALTRLHADALVTLDGRLADTVQDLVTVVPLDALT